MTDIQKHSRRKALPEATFLPPEVGSPGHVPPEPLHEPTPTSTEFFKKSHSRTEIFKKFIPTRIKPHAYNENCYLCVSGNPISSEKRKRDEWSIRISRFYE